MAQYDIWKIYDDMEAHLLSSMSRNLMRHTKEEKEYGFEWEQWQAAKLREMRKFRKHNQAIIGKHTKNLPADIKQHLQNEYKQGLVGILQKHKELFGNHGLTKDLSEGFFSMDDRKIQALIDSVNNDLKEANHAALRMANDAYRQTIHRAAMFAANGVTTEKQAVQLAINDFAKQGLTCIKYKNGARHNIKEYAEMAVRTAEARAMLMGEGKARQELGETLVRISKHGTACPLCVPFENKVLIDDVYSGGTWENSKEDYERVPASSRASVRLMSEAMKAGLYHPRCRHGLGTYYVDLWGEKKPEQATPPKEPEKTAEEIAAEQAAAKAAAEAEKQKKKMQAFHDLYNLNMRDSLTPDDMAKITALEDDLMMDGNFEEFEQWQAANKAKMDAAFDEFYTKWEKADYASLTAAEQAEYDKAYNALVDSEWSATPQKQHAKYRAWADNRAKLEAEAKAAKIKADTEKLYKALYAGQTGQDIDALKQDILNDAEYLDAYNAMTEPLYDAAKADYNAKKDILKQAKQALTDAETAEKAAKKAAKDAKDAAKDAADDVANGWLPNFDKAYYAKYGKYPIHTDSQYNAARQAWRQAKYYGGDPDAAIIKLADSDLTNTELKKLALEKEAADKAAELAKKKAEKKAAKQAAEQAEKAADAAKDELERTKQTMLSLIDDPYTQDRKDAALWFDSNHGGFAAADKYFDPKAKAIHKAATAKEQNGFYTYTEGSGGHNRPLAGFRKPWSQPGTGWEEKFFVGPKQVWIDFEGKGEQIRGLTTLIEKSTYDDDLWLQSGQGFATIEGFLNIPYGTLQYMTDADMQKFIGYQERMYSFISTAVNEGGGSMFNAKPLKINFYAPKDSQMLYASDVGAYGKGENEMILQRGGSYKITKMYWGKDATDGNRRKIFVDMEIHPEEGYDLFQQDPAEWTGSLKNYKNS